MFQNFSFNLKSRSAYLFTLYSRAINLVRILHRNLSIQDEGIGMWVVCVATAKKVVALVDSIVKQYFIVKYRLDFAFISNDHWLI